MLEFTLLGYCLRRSSFKLRVARVALSLAKRHHQQCLRRPLSGPTGATRNLNEERRRQ